MSKRFALWLALGVVVLGGAGVTQYLRHAWPFSSPGDSSSAGETDTGDLMPGLSHAAHAGHGPTEGSTATGPVGYAPVTIDPELAGALQLATAAVEERDFTRTLRSVGVVALDETRSAHVHSKVKGWIDGIYANFVGQHVRRGEPLCALYSQEVYAAEIEFLSVLERGARASQSMGPGADRDATDPLLLAARRRLALWDVPPEEIARLEKTREPKRTFALLAPRAGAVVAKEAIQGMYIDPSLELYTLSDLSRIWVLVDIYEADVPDVRVGARARLRIEGQGAPIDAAVSFLSPTIDEATRTRKARFELGNEDGRLLPGAFVSAEMELAVGTGLAIPESAVIRTGTRSIVFVVHGEHNEHLMPRAVTLGPLIGDRYRIDAGVVAGERVATGAQFLLDSESRLRATSAPGGGHVH